MSNVTFLALVRGLLWMPLLYVALRFKAWESVLVVALILLSNYYLSENELLTAALVGSVSAPLIIYLLIDRLYKRPEHLKAIAVAQVTEARTIMHDALSDARAWEARARVAERKLDEAGLGVPPES